MGQEESQEPPKEPKETSSWTYGRNAAIATVLLGVGGWQFGNLLEIGIEDYWSQYVVPAAENTYEYVVNHPEVWWKIFATIVLSGFVINQISKRVFKGDSTGSKVKQGILKSVIDFLKRM